MKKFIVFIQVVLITTFAGSAVQAEQNIKIAFVNTQSIIVKWQKQIDEQLQLQFDGEKSKLMSLQNKIKNKIDALNKDAAIMSPSVVNSTKSELDNMNMEYQNLATEFQKNYTVEGRRLLKDRMVYLEQAVNIVAKKQNIDIVLQKNTALFTGDTIDVTGNVTSYLKSKGKN